MIVATALALWEVECARTTQMFQQASLCADPDKVEEKPWAVLCHVCAPANLDPRVAASGCNDALGWVDFQLPAPALLQGNRPHLQFPPTGPKCHTGWKIQKTALWNLHDEGVQKSGEAVCGQISTAHCPQAVRQCTKGVSLPTAPRQWGSAQKEFHYPLRPGSEGVYRGCSTADCPLAVLQRTEGAPLPTAHCPL